MSADQLNKFINTTVKYGGLISQFKKDPDVVAKGYDLSAGEIEAASSGEEAQLVSAGVPQALAARWVRNLSY